MAKDAKGHGSDGRGSAGGSYPYRRDPVTGLTSAQPAHQAGVSEATAPKPVTIFHQDGEYAVPNSASGKTHYFTNDKADAESTARVIHGHNITIKHRAKAWGPEMG